MYAAKVKIRNKEDARDFVENFENQAGIGYIDENILGHVEIDQDSRLSMIGGTVITYDVKEDQFYEFSRGQGWSDQSQTRISKEELIEVIYQNRNKIRVF